MERGDNQAIRAVIRAIPADFQPVQEADDVRIARGTDTWLLHPIWAGEGLPADARRIRDMLANDLARRDAIPVVVARRMSPGAREVLHQETISWADVSGRADIVIPGQVYITRLDPIPADALRPFVWSAAADAIAETLLTWMVRRAPDTRNAIDRVGTIAAAADVSVAHAARVLRHFDEQRYTEKTGAERGRSATREFRDAGRMLSDWAGQHALVAPRAAAEFHVPWREHERSIAMAVTLLPDLHWAVTGIAAADRIAPYLTSVPTVDLYVSENELSQVRQRLSLQAEVTEVSDSGGRIRVFTARDYLFALTDEWGGVRLASPVRVYGDLLHQRGRVAEAAEFLRETAIGF